MIWIYDTGKVWTGRDLLTRFFFDVEMIYV